MTGVYRNLKTELWTDPKVRALSFDERLVFLYAITSPHGHLSGIYIMPMTVAALETGLTADRIRSLLAGAALGRLIAFDPVLDVVWVRAMLKHQGSGDKINRSVIAQVRGLRASTLLSEFVARYGAVVPGLRDAASDGVSGRVSDAPFLQEKEKEQEKKKESTPSVADAPAPRGKRTAATASPTTRGVDSNGAGAPTRHLIDVWRQERQRIGLGPETQSGRHAKEFADLYQRVGCDVARAEAVVRRFFQEDDGLKRKNGPSIGTFSTLMDGLILRAGTRSKEPDDDPGQADPGYEAASRAYMLEEIEAIRRKRGGHAAGNGTHE